MKRGARDSQVINNFFSLATIIIISVVLTLYTKYIVKEETTEDSEKEVLKLACEEEAYTLSKVFNQTLLNKSQKALDKGYYKLEGSFLKPEFTPSKIEKILSIDETDVFFINEIGIKPKNNIEKFLKIKYEIIENDKNKESYILTSFRINAREIFRVNTDLSFLYKSNIKDRINCTIKVFKNHVQK